MMSMGNPHFMRGLKDRRQELLNRLKSTPKSDWEKVKSRFAFDFDLRIETVEKYCQLLEQAGLLEG